MIYLDVFRMDDKYSWSEPTPHHEDGTTLKIPTSDNSSNKINDTCVSGILDIPIKNNVKEEFRLFRLE